MNNCKVFVFVCLFFYSSFLFAGAKDDLLDIPDIHEDMASEKENYDLISKDLNNLTIKSMLELSAINHFTNLTSPMVFIKPNEKLEDRKAIYESKKFIKK